MLRAYSGPCQSHTSFLKILFSARVSTETHGVFNQFSYESSKVGRGGRVEKPYLISSLLISALVDTDASSWCLSQAGRELVVFGWSDF